MRWSKSLKAAGMKDWACRQFKKISSKYKDYGKLNKQSYSQLMFYLVLNILSCCVKQTCGGAEIIAFPLKLLNRCFDKGHLMEFQVLKSTPDKNIFSLSLSQPSCSSAVAPILPSCCFRP